VHNEAETVAAEIKDQAVIADEINSAAESPLDVVRCPPNRTVCGCKPSAYGSFCLRVTRPEFLESSQSDHLHAEK
jgi:hypothetical protein